MDIEDVLDINGNIITTYVLKSEEGINNVLDFMFCNSTTKVIGFDIQWHLFLNLSNLVTNCANIFLCDGCICVIIPLPYLDSIPESLLNFLWKQDFTFVGVGINEKLCKLETLCGDICRNVVELGPFAAIVLGMPHLRTCGVDELALVVNNFDLQSYSIGDELLEISGHNLLSKEVAEVAMVNVYSCYEIGKKLFQEKTERRRTRNRELLIVKEHLSKRKIGLFGLYGCMRIALVLVILFLLLGTYFK